MYDTNIKYFKFSSFKCYFESCLVHIMTHFLNTRHSFVEFICSAELGNVPFGGIAPHSEETMSSFNIHHGFPWGNQFIMNLGEPVYYE
jgi:hypothetical protein